MKPQWIWNVILVSVVAGLVGYMLPLLLKETPDVRRANLAATQSELVKRGQAVKQQYAQLKNELGEYQTLVSDIWKISAVRKMREDQLIAESHEHLVAIKDLMQERRASLESLMAETTQGLRDAIGVLREKTARRTTTVPDVVAPVDDPIEQNTPTTTVISPKVPPPVQQKPQEINVKPSKPAAKPAPVPSPPPLGPAPPVVVSTDIVKSNEFPISFTNAVLGFVIILIVLVSFSMLNEYRTADPSGGLFSPRRPLRPVVDEEPESAGGFFDMLYPRERVEEATPIPPVQMLILLLSTTLDTLLRAISPSTLAHLATKIMLKAVGGKSGPSVELWKKLKVAVQTSQIDETQLRKYQNVQTEALQEAQKQLLKQLTDEELEREKPPDASTMYSRESLVLRYSLRRHDGIQRAVQTLWNFEAPRDGLGCLLRDGYVSFYVCVAKYLDSSFDTTKAIATVQEEWEHDRKGNDAMSYVLFFDSLFQLADLWVDSVDPNEYVEFLDGIASNILVSIGSTHRLKEYADIKCIQPLSESDEDDDDEDNDKEDARTIVKSSKQESKNEAKAGQASLPQTKPTLGNKKTKPQHDLPPCRLSPSHNVEIHVRDPGHLVAQSHPTEHLPFAAPNQSLAPSQGRLQEKPVSKSREPLPSTRFSPTKHDQVVHRRDQEHERQPKKSLTYKRKQSPSNLENSFDRQAVTSQLMSFSHQTSEKDSQSSRHKGKNRQKLGQFIPSSQEHANVGTLRFVEKALPVATTVLHIQTLFEDDEIRSATNLTMINQLRPENVVDESNATKSIRVLIQPTNTTPITSREINEAASSAQLDPVDYSNEQAMPTKPKSHSSHDHYDGIVGISYHTNKHLAPLHTVAMDNSSAVFSVENDLLPYFLAPLQGTGGSLQDDLSPPREKSNNGALKQYAATSHPKLLPNVLQNDSLSFCRLTIRKAFQGRAGFCLLPLTMDDTLDHSVSAPLLKINRREVVSLECSPSREKPVRSRLAMLQIKQKVHQTHAYSGRLMSTSYDAYSSS
ncbi:hypothetical protein AeNC1_002969 [Aphanomyces euteiches]|nr:hypothetical protein AeNC1_002969 [Aphanomyces euteiches]